jgi:hypothetical protein
MHVTVSSFGKNRSKALRWSAFPENFMGVTSIFGAHLIAQAEITSRSE